MKDIKTVNKIIFISKVIATSCIFFYASVDMHAMKKNKMRKSNHLALQKVTEDFETTSEKQKSLYCNKFVIGSLLIANTCLWGITTYFLYNGIQDIKKENEVLKQILSAPLTIHLNHNNAIQGSILKK